MLSLITPISAKYRNLHQETTFHNFLQTEIIILTHAREKKKMFIRKFPHNVLLATSLLHQWLTQTGRSLTLHQNFESNLLLWTWSAFGTTSITMAEPVSGLQSGTLLISSLTQKKKNNGDSVTTTTLLLSSYRIINYGKIIGNTEPVSFVRVFIFKAGLQFKIQQHNSPWLMLLQNPFCSPCGKYFWRASRSLALFPEFRAVWPWPSHP